MERASEDLHRYAQARIYQYRYYRNKVVPAIARLPVEIFSEILTLSVPVEGWDIERLRNLGRVSKLWKEVVLSTPKLWAVVVPPDLLFPEKAEEEKATKERWRHDVLFALRQSRNVPLTVLCHTYGLNPNQHYLDLIRPLASRWEAVDVRLHGPPSDQLIAVLSQPAPILERLKVVFRKEESEIRKIVLSYSERLRHVYIDNASLSWNIVGGLRTLHLSRIRFDTLQPNLRLPELLHVLQSSPALESLKLMDVRCSEAKQESDALAVNRRNIAETLPPVLLSRLITLDIRDVDCTLAVTLSTRLHAGMVSRFRFSVAAEFDSSLPLIDGDILFARTLLRTVDDQSHIHIILSQRSIWIRVHLDSEHCKDSEMRVGVEKELVKKGFEFQIGARKRDYSGLEKLERDLKASELGIPIYVDLGHYSDAYKRSSGPTITLPLQFLINYSTLERLYFNKHADTWQVLEYLSQPRLNPRTGTFDWPCPRLKSIRFQDVVGDWEKLLSFLTERYVEQDLDHGPEHPSSLTTLIFSTTYPPPDVLKQITCVKRVLLTR